MENPRHWRLNEQRYRLFGEQCPDPNCQEKIFPPRDICPYCGKNTTIYEAPVGIEQKVQASS